MPQIVELLIVSGATKELSKTWQDTQINHILQSTGLPLLKVILNSSEWHKEHITEGIASICKVKLAFWDLKIMNPSIMKDPPITCTPSQPLRM